MAERTQPRRGAQDPSAPGHLPAGPAGMPSILRRIIERKRARLMQSRSRVPASRLKAAVRDLPPPRSLAAALRAGSPPGVIAELKRRSPSRGVLREPLDLTGLLAAYVRGGAEAVSVLTEEDFFDGSLEDLRHVREANVLPVLRKDFILEPYQLYESRAAGADAVLLIAAALPGALLAELAALAAELGMEALVETHTEEEVGRALETGAGMVGINNRDLHTFRVSLETCLSLAPLVPPDRLVVAESGIRSRKEVLRLQSAGIRAVLIGEALVVADDAAALLARLKGKVP